MEGGRFLFIMSMIPRHHHHRASSLDCRSGSRAGLRRGATLVELILFMAIVAAVGISMLPLLFSATEDRLLQQTVSAVEQNGVQILQTIGYHVRHAERIVAPDRQEAGTLLTLQTSSGMTNPTIIGLSSGALVLIQRAIRQDISSSQVAVESFWVQNISTSNSRGSLLIRFTLSRTIRLQAPRRYSQTFEGAFAPYPADDPKGDDCHCAVPGCGGASLYVWQVCTSGTCETAQTQLQCP